MKQIPLHIEKQPVGKKPEFIIRQMQARHVSGTLIVLELYICKLRHHISRQADPHKAKCSSIDLVPVTFFHKLDFHDQALYFHFELVMSTPGFHETVLFHFQPSGI